MKIILSVKEAKAIEGSLIGMQSKVNELEGTSVSEFKTLNEFFKNAKNNMVIKYKLFKGIEVSIDEEFVADLITLWSDATVIMMPTCKAMFNLMETVMPIMDKVNEMTKAFTDKYLDKFQTVTSEQIYEPSAEELASRPF